MFEISYLDDVRKIPDDMRCYFDTANLYVIIDAFTFLR